MLFPALPNPYWCMKSEYSLGTGFSGTNRCTYYLCVQRWLKHALLHRAGTIQSTLHKTELLLSKLSLCVSLLNNQRWSAGSHYEDASTICKVCEALKWWFVNCGPWTMSDPWSSGWWFMEHLVVVRGVLATHMVLSLSLLLNHFFKGYKYIKYFPTLTFKCK